MPIMQLEGWVMDAAALASMTFGCIQLLVGNPKVFTGQQRHNPSVFWIFCCWDLNTSAGSYRPGLYFHLRVTNNKTDPPRNFGNIRSSWHSATTVTVVCHFQTAWVKHNPHKEALVLDAAVAGKAFRRRTLRSPGDVPGSPGMGKTADTRGVIWKGPTRPPAPPPAPTRRLMNKLRFNARDTPHRWSSWESEERALRSLNVKSAELSRAAIGADVLSARLLAHDKQNVRSPAASCESLKNNRPLAYASPSITRQRRPLGAIHHTGAGRASGPLCSASGDDTDTRYTEKAFIGFFYDALIMVSTSPVSPCRYRITVDDFGPEPVFFLSAMMVGHSHHVDTWYNRLNR
ncbi:hypothetical protein CCH79_00016785 [Gambusia affinis]|uniref:Uncharacterized protein n=1 Tax=Gambusia affinis TaxID=33528 RepID=A0A315VM61_GAMAF|nr:hypothetical protein CCH79_00016785 [Gambusia affinis]